jgi:hypothetical protein
MHMGYTLMDTRTRHTHTHIIHCMKLGTCKHYTRETLTRDTSVCTCMIYAHMLHAQVIHKHLIYGHGIYMIHALVIHAHERNDNVIQAHDMHAKGKSRACTLHTRSRSRYASTLQDTAEITCFHFPATLTPSK